MISIFYKTKYQVKIFQTTPWKIEKLTIFRSKFNNPKHFIIFFHFFQITLYVRLLNACMCESQEPPSPFKSTFTRIILSLLTGAYNSQQLYHDMTENL